jgi:O-antigen/teichoic acid export membrane protein
MSSPAAKDPAPGRPREAGEPSLSRNALLGGLAFLATVAASLVISPQMVHGLGLAAYGVLGVASELTGYCGLLDLGIRVAMSYFTARALAAGGCAELEEPLRAAVGMLTGLGLLLAILAGPLAWNFPRLFKIDNADALEVRLTVGLLLLMMAVGLPATLPNALLAGLRRFDLSNGIVILAALLNAVFVLLALGWRGGLLAVAAAHAAARAISWLLQFIVLGRMRLQVRLFPLSINPKVAKDVLSYGGASLALNLAQMATLQMDLMIIGSVTGARAAGQYQIGRYLGIHLTTLMAGIAMTFATPFTHHHTTGEWDRVRSLLLGASRYCNALAFLVAALILVFGQPFIALWMGREFTHGAWWDRSDTVLVLITLAMLARSLSAVAIQYLLGARHMRFLTRVRVAEAGVSVVGGIFSARLLGIGGVALVKLLVSTASHFGFIIPYVLRKTQIRASAFFREAAARPILVGLVAGGMGLLVSAAVPPLGWKRLLAEGTLAGLAGLIAAWFAVVERAEKTTLLGQLRSIASTFAGSPRGFGR